MSLHRQGQNCSGKPVYRALIADRETSGDEDEAPLKKTTKRKLSRGTPVKRQQRESIANVLHWIDENDPILISNTTSSLRFTIRGNPLPLRRHRTNRGFVYNPSAKAQASFRKAVLDLIFSESNPSLCSKTGLPEPFFGDDKPLAMTIVFRTRRPNLDFVGGRRGQGRLRVSGNARSKRVAPTSLWPATRIDVDNLAKFVLDSLNGILYEDDRQVVSLHVTKLRDDEDECMGSTEIGMRVIEADDVNAMLDRSFSFFD